MPTVWLIRHGESVSNADLPTKHPEASELTPRGHEEARCVAQAFTKAPDLSVVSSYVRARETAVSTQKRFPHMPVEVWPVHEFTYLHPVRYDGTTGSQRGPVAQAYWERNDPFEKEAGEGESFTEMLARVQQTVVRLQTHPANFIAVFSHGLFLRALLWSLLIGDAQSTPGAMAQYLHFVQAVWMPNGAIVRVEFRHDGHTLFSGFDVTHLRALTGGD